MQEYTANHANPTHKTNRLLNDRKRISSTLYIRGAHLSKTFSVKCAGHNNMLPVIRGVTDPWIQCLLYNCPDQDMNLDETMVSFLLVVCHQGTN